jgi:hypothetical protein
MRLLRGLGVANRSLRYVSRYSLQFLPASSLTSSSLFKSIQSIVSSADGARTVTNTGGGIFQAIPTSTPDGIQIVHNTGLYKKFDVFEQQFSNF